MKEIVDRILDEEKSARIRIEQAQSQADAIILKAREESKSLIEDTVKKAEESASQKKEQSRNTFLSDKDRMLKETSDNVSLSRGNREKDIPKIAHKIFSRVITIKD